MVLKLTGPIPEKAFLWYGYGFDPVLQPDRRRRHGRPRLRADRARRGARTQGACGRGTEPRGRPGRSPWQPVAPRRARAATPPRQPDKGPVKLLIITGRPRATTGRRPRKSLKDILSKGGKIAVDVTTTPAKDLTDENLAKYDVLLLNYKDTPNGPPETNWSDANKEAFLKAVREGKGLVVFHFASSAFTKPNWEEFEKAIAGGWRTQGFHGPEARVQGQEDRRKHPISEGLPAEFEHTIDELYQNSVMLPGNEVLATAYSDPGKPQGTGKDEPVIWVNTYGKGRVYNNALGHDVEAMADPNFRPGCAGA